MLTRSTCCVWSTPAHFICPGFFECLARYRTNIYSQSSPDISFPRDLFSICKRSAFIPRRTWKLALRALRFGLVLDIPLPRTASREIAHPTEIRAQELPIPGTASPDSIFLTVFPACEIG